MGGAAAARAVFWAVCALVAAAILVPFFLVPDSWLKALAMGVAGPALVVAGPVFLVVQLRFRGRAVRAVGTVEACVDNGPEEPSCTLTVRYTALDGRERTLTDDRAPRRPVGGEVRIMYDPDDPADAKLHRPAASVLFTAAAMVVMGAALAYFYWRGDPPG
ncbi:hypothetical protein GCM10010191_35670 [Actinomadura vinacea]|uniref:DUF3592 domain-containing protein n=1 Tax=Actinomadura vinacea TaxID=115336 RepID=A0ABN3J4X2_9ACTN